MPPHRKEVEGPHYSLARVEVWASHLAFAGMGEVEPVSSVVCGWNRNDYSG